VTCAGDTPSDSRTNAEAYLDVLSDRKGSHLEEKWETDYASRIMGLVR